MTAMPRAPRHGPKAEGKTVLASARKPIPAVIGEAFAEAHRRDPHHLRPWFAVVDGNNAQIAAIRGYATQYQVNVPVLIDLIHVFQLSMVSAQQSCISAGHIVVVIDMTLLRRCGLRIPAEAGKFAPQLQVFAVGLLECGACRAWISSRCCFLR